MSKDKKTIKNKNVENVNNFREYFNSNFETIELTIKYAQDIRFILKRVISHLSNNFPDNLYKNALTSIINWIDTSIELHFAEQEFLLKNSK